MKHPSLLALPFLLAACGSAKEEPTTPTGTPSGTEAGTPAGTAAGTTPTGSTGTSTTTGTPTGTATGTGTGTGSTTLPAVGSVSGRTYRFDPTQLNVIQPAGTGNLLTPENPILFQVLQQRAAELDIRMGFATDTGQPPAQDLCIETLDLTVAWTDPAMRYGPGTVPVPGFGAVLNLDDVQIDGVFLNAGTDVEAHWTAEMNVAPLGPLVGGDVCQLIAPFGNTCQPCVASPGDCLGYEAEGAGTEVAALSVVERTTNDIDQDPACYSP